MQKEEGDVLAITIKEPSNPSTFIVLAVEQLNNWTWVGFSKNVGKKFVMHVPMYFSTFLIRWILIWLILICPIISKFCT